MPYPEELNTDDPSNIALDQVMSRDQLLVFLSQRQLVASTRSPIGQFLGKEARLPAVVDELDSSDQLENAFRVLIKPRQQMTQRVATPNGAFASYFYSSGSLFRTPTYGCWRTGNDEIRVSGPWSNFQLADEVGRHLEPSATCPPTGAVFPLSVDGLAVFSLVVDFVKTRYMQSFLNAKQVRQVRVSFAEMTGMATLASSNSDLQQFRNCLQSLWPEILLRSDLDINLGLKNLADSRLLAHDAASGDWLTTEILTELVFDLFFHLPAVSVTKQDVNDPHPSRMLFIRGRRLWQIACDTEKLGPGRLFIRDVEPSVAFDDLMTFFGDQASHQSEPTTDTLRQEADEPRRRVPMTTKKATRLPDSSKPDSKSSNAEPLSPTQASQTSNQENKDAANQELFDVFGSFFGSAEGKQLKQWNSPPESSDGSQGGDK